MPIIVVKESGLPILPLPKPKPRVITKPRLILVRTPKLVQVPAQTSVADEHLSVDERTQLILDQIADEARQLDDDETRDLWLDGIETYRQSGDISELIELTKYRRRVVDLDEFVFGQTYLGLKRDEIYPGVLEFMHEIDTDKYVEVVLKGALGYGKTTSANILLARAIYKTSCMRHPQSTFGIRSGSSLVFTIQSLRLSTAKKAVFEDFGGLIKNSPYFKHIYPYNKMITSQMVFDEQKVSVLPVSSSTNGVISMNVLGGVMDEMNFMQKVLKSKSQNAEVDGTYSQAKAMYNAIARRRKSRFAKLGKLPGVLFLISSSRFPDDFTELKADEAQMCGGNDPTIFVVSKAIWDVKGRENFLPEEFRVMVGNAMVRTRILKDGEEPFGGCDVINVPMDFYGEFEKDPDGSLRDFAGVTVLASRPFITKRTAIYECVEEGRKANVVNPFREEQYNFALGIPHPDRDKLRTDIKIFRTAHVDLGLKRDACGIAIGYIAGQKLIETNDPVTKIKSTQLKPVIAFDVIMRVIPPPNGEIEFAHIREFLIMMRDQYGLPIEYVTFDGFQSVDSKQILRTKGFKADYLSVEKIEPYRSLRDALYDGCVQLPAHQFLNNELAGLEYIRGIGLSGDRVDHRPNGTKDVADAVCGVTSFLLKRRLAWHPNLTGHAAVKAQPVTPEGAAASDVVQAIRRTTIRKSVFRRNISRR